MACIVAITATFSKADAEEAQWVWAYAAEADVAGEDASVPRVSEGEVAFFRKPINLRSPADGKIEIAADDRYTLYVNGTLVGEGESSKQLDQWDITDHLTVGRNVVAIRVENVDGETAAMVARVSVKPQGSDQWYNFHSGSSWRVTSEENSLWSTATYNDRLWGAAVALGALGETAPWDVREEQVAQSDVQQRERFQIQKGFGVQRLMNDDQVGSVIAMAFNEFGHIILSQEGGPLLLVFDKDGDGVAEQIRTYCDKVTSCQGILPLNGAVFVTGSGPEGHALYKLTDDDRNGTLETVETVVKFNGNFGEHGAHGLSLGPDGMIYITLGGYVQADGEGGPGETLVDYYEGDVLPRYEDPAGHGRGIQVPGGTIVRTNTDGSIVERIAGGLRNVYDLAFHPSGRLLVHDADMEADIDTAWYRPTMLFDITEGGEYGWRPGWSKWPEHYMDRLPSIADTGRGSPTGATCYEHYMFPVRYQNSMFYADWSEGRILNVRVESGGATTKSTAEVFLQGQPLNVTDLAVGPDGALYFCTGGRGTAGGVYRIIYRGEVPDRMRNLGTGVAAAIRQPQIDAAWSRQELASIRRELGTKWGQLVAGVAYSDDNPSHYRTRALDLMQLFGPVPSDEVLVELATSSDVDVRAKVASLMGLHPSVEIRESLETLLSDEDSGVRRAAAEAMLRSGQFPTQMDAVIELTSEEDRTLSFLGRRILERQPTDKFKSLVLNHPDTHTKIVGMLALIGADPSESTCRTVLRHCGLLLDEYLSDADFVDNLRLIQVAISRGEIDPAQLKRLRVQVAEEFPAGDSRMNLELIKLAAALNAVEIADRGLDYIEGSADEADRTLVAMCLQFLAKDWTPKQRFRLLKFYENEALRQTEGSLSMYVMAATRDFAKTLSDEDIAAVIDQGAVWRNAALAAIYRLPRPIDDTTAKRLRNLDRQLLADPKPGDVERRLRTGIIAMLATADDEQSGEYLRRLWRSEPSRRGAIAMTLAQQPEGDNWDYLVRSLAVLEDGMSDTVLQALLSVPVATDDPMALRQLILLGVRNEQRELSFERIEQLLEHWTGLQRPDDAATSMRPWQKWFAKTYPDRLPAEPPSADQSRWDFEQLVEYIDSDEGRLGDPIAGEAVFAKAQCAACHQLGGNGDSIGPNLTNLSRRFAKREVIESILYPGHVVSDQYASKKVLTVDGRLVIGLVSDRGDALQIRDSLNQTIELAKEDVDQILPSTTSIMPSGLLDDLTIDEIRVADTLAGACGAGPDEG